MAKIIFLSTHQLRLAFPLALGLLLIACTPEPEVKDVQASEGEIEYLFDRWNNALQTGDASTVAAYYANDAVLLPMVSNKMRTDGEGIREYFGYFLALQPNARIDENNITINGNIAINAGVYTFTVTKKGQEQEIQARYSFVYERQNDGEWLIINHHSSAMPETMVTQSDLLEGILIKEKE